MDRRGNTPGEEVPTPPSSALPPLATTVTENAPVPRTTPTTPTTPSLLPRPSINNPARHSPLPMGGIDSAAPALEAPETEPTRREDDHVVARLRAVDPSNEDQADSVNRVPNPDACSSLQWEGQPSRTPEKYETTESKLTVEFRESAKTLNIDHSYFDLKLVRRGMFVDIEMRHNPGKFECTKYGTMKFSSEPAISKLMKHYDNFITGKIEEIPFQVDAEKEPSNIRVVLQETYPLIPRLTLLYCKESGESEIIDSKPMAIDERRSPHGLSYVIGDVREDEDNRKVYDVRVSFHYCQQYEVKKSSANQTTQSEWNSDQAHKYLYEEHEKTKVQKAELSEELIKVQRECAVLKQQLDMKSSMTTEEGDSLRMEVRSVREESERLKDEVEKLKKEKEREESAMQQIKEKAVEAEKRANELEEKIKKARIILT